MTKEIMTLELDEVVPDPEQPRQHFDRDAMERLKAAIYAVGQLQPIRVRWSGGRWMIVDGQRRWLSLSALAKEHPRDERFQVIRAYAGDELDEDAASRRVVQVLSNIGEDLTPTEKAAALSEIVRVNPTYTVAELGERLGVPKGQVQFLRQLASSPGFIRDMGTGKDALPLWNLVTLVRLHRKLRKWDDDQFRETQGAHRRIADREVRKLGARAQEESWGKRKLQNEAERLLARITGDREEESTSDRLAPLKRALSKVMDVSGEQRDALIDLLRDHLDRLVEPVAKPRRRRAGTGC